MTNIKEKIRSYFKNRKEVVAAYLFGSRAKGHERRSSDVDVGIVLHHGELHRSFELQKQYMVDLGRLLRKDMHTVILNTVGELLLKQVFSNGKLICVNNENEFKQFKMYKFSIIAEFGYYLEVAQAGFVQSLN